MFVRNFVYLPANVDTISLSVDYKEYYCRYGCIFEIKNIMSEQGNGSRGKLVNAASHLIFIIILFILPEVMMAIAIPHRHSFVFYPGFYFKTLVYIAVFYINYLWVIDRTLVLGNDRRKIGIFIAANIALIIACLVLCWIASNVWFPTPPRKARRPQPEHYVLLKTASFFLRDIVMLVLTIALAVALRLSSKWKDFQRQRQELLADQRAVELDNLKSQLNPHFLFNTLNTIYALISVAPDKAQGAVHRLSGLLRYMLYEDESRVHLDQEADFIENYVTLMRLRLAGREARLSISLEDHGGDNVPPLLFIPLVENAFKYGVTGDDDTPIDINIYIDGSDVVCTTSNTYTATAVTSDRPNSGIGLANLRRRLSLIYGGRASLNTTSDGHSYNATLRIPL